VNAVHAGADAVNAHIDVVVTEGVADNNCWTVVLAMHYGRRVYWTSLTRIHPMKSGEPL
jgi:hypothetical protein